MEWTEDEAESIPNGERRMCREDVVGKAESDVERRWSGERIEWRENEVETG